MRDTYPSCEAVHETTAAAMPDLEIQVVQDMPLYKYISLEKEAKLSLTFGVGLDVYFIGIFLRRGIGFTAYKDFRCLRAKDGSSSIGLLRAILAS